MLSYHSDGPSEVVHEDGVREDVVYRDTSASGWLCAQVLKVCESLAFFHKFSEIVNNETKI